MEDRPICSKCRSSNVISKHPQWRCKVCGAAWLKTSELQIETLNNPFVNALPPHQVENFPTKETAVILFDAHLDPQLQNHPSFEVAMTVVRDLKPKIVIVGGDWMELGSLCFFDKHKRFLMEGRRYDLEVNQGRKELDQLRGYCPDSRILFFEGNHEYRAVRYTEENAEMIGKLDIQRDLDLSGMDIEWLPFNEVVKLGKLNILHGLFYNIYFARSTLQAIGESCLFGHAHKSQTYVQRLHNDKTPNIAQGVGCLCDTDPQWKRGIPTNFVNSFAIVDFRDGGFFNIHEVFVVNGQASYGGNTWKIM